MKKTILALTMAATLSACITPLKPIPPLGCTYADAVLVWMSDNTCQWYYIGCGE